MNPLRDQTSTLLARSRRLSLLTLVIMLASCSLAMGLKPAAHAAPIGDAQLAVLEFIQPTNGAIFSTRDEIPIMLRAVASNDVFLSGEVFANQFNKIGAVSYCCALCPCFRPLPGQETILQIPVPRNGTAPPWRP